MRLVTNYLCHAGLLLTLCSHGQGAGSDTTLARTREGKLDTDIDRTTEYLELILKDSENITGQHQVARRRQTANKYAAMPANRTATRP